MTMLINMRSVCSFSRTYATILMRKQWNEKQTMRNFFHHQPATIKLNGNRSKLILLNKLFKRSAFNRNQNNAGGSGGGGELITMRFRDLWRSFFFTSGLTTFGFAIAAIADYETDRTQMDKLRNWFERNFEQNRAKRIERRDQLSTYWNNLTRTERAFYAILLVNACVYALWKVRALDAFMFRNFTSNIYRKKMFSPSLLSMFSHNSFVHFAINMYVLSSFVRPLRERYSAEEFLAVYLGAGLSAAFFSQAVKILQRCPKPSVGASGAILGIIAIACQLYPHSQIGIVFLPSSITVTAEKALLGIMAFDFLGVLFRWSLLDHAGHLGGALFGLWYINYGHKYLWDKRYWLTNRWSEFRRTFKK